MIKFRFNLNEFAEKLYFPVLCYYLIAFVLLIYIMLSPRFKDGGNFGPNLIVYIVTGAVLSLLVIVYGGLYLFGGRAYRISFFIHLSAILLWFLVGSVTH